MEMDFETLRKIKGVIRSDTAVCRVALYLRAQYCLNCVLPKLPLDGADSGDLFAWVNGDLELIEVKHINHWTGSWPFRDFIVDNYEPYHAKSKKAIWYFAVSNDLSAFGKIDVAKTFHLWEKQERLILETGGREKIKKNVYVAPLDAVQWGTLIDPSVADDRLDSWIKRKMGAG